MNNYLSRYNKKEKLVLGVLSGTSVDAVDIVLVRISGFGVSAAIKVTGFRSFPVSSSLKDFVLKCSSKLHSNVEDICRLNFVMGRFFAASVNKFIQSNKLTKKDIDLIGSHGQTIYHFPFNQKLFGFNSRSTLQIGDPSIIANETGILTVGDFRTADVSANGEGAPLAPYLDFILFRSKIKNRALVNIGGISNATFLKKNCTLDQVIASDTGPGNMMIDILCKKLFNKKFDKNGQIASKGKVIEEMFRYLCDKDKFYKRKFPKSTGREYYGSEFVNDVLAKFRKANKFDIITTFTKFTAYTIQYNLKSFPVDELIVSGGGAKNLAIMNYLKTYFTKSEVRVINDNGINEDNKEAVLFAVLANDLIMGYKSGMPAVTGSSKSVFQGKICFA